MEETEGTLDRASHVEEVTPKGPSMGPRELRQSLGWIDVEIDAQRKGKRKARGKRRLRKTFWETHFQLRETESPAQNHDITMAERREPSIGR